MWGVKGGKIHFSIYYEICTIDMNTRHTGVTQIGKEILLLNFKLNGFGNSETREDWRTENPDEKTHTECSIDSIGIQRKRKINPWYIKLQLLCDCWEFLEYESVHGWVAPPWEKNCFFTNIKNQRSPPPRQKEVLKSERDWRTRSREGTETTTKWIPAISVLSTLSCLFRFGWNGVCIALQSVLWKRPTDKNRLGGPTLPWAVVRRTNGTVPLRISASVGALSFPPWAARGKKL